MPLLFLDEWLESICSQCIESILGDCPIANKCHHFCIEQVECGNKIKGKVLHCCMYCMLSASFVSTSPEVMSTEVWSNLEAVGLMFSPCLVKLRFLPAWWLVSLRFEMAWRSVPVATCACIPEISAAYVWSIHCNIRADKLWPVFLDPLAMCVFKNFFQFGVCSKFLDKDWY